MKIDLSSEQSANLFEMIEQYQSYLKDKIYEYNKIQLESHVNELNELLKKSGELYNFIKANNGI